MGKKTKAKTHVRDGIMDFIHRLKDFLQKPGPIDGNQMKIRLEKLEEKWKEFEEIQCEIEFSEEQEENMELHSQVTTEFEEKYFEERAGLEIFKESSTTTKFRVVFDGSAKTTTNRSLNDALLTGPVIQDDLFELMIRSRKNAVALVADIEKMYRQIRVHPDDACLQRILWRFTSSESIKVYELQTVTYGLSPSSFIATRVLQQLGVSYSDKFKLASYAAQEDFYMDDFLSGTDSVEKAKQLLHEMQ
ncbi:uncharacterized protein LOC129761616 [Toxorhynchites rutilus septentrionalis]|uniref:uncharacterized protein LOC129761616 n=1 Tax=Toxorhynchites rutilus septentrionalis TaxID=329112 RepID=UPI00247A39EE|nr:uncharacterized protein LOC129761616 [Toxorhynchites rutilus septentrionalis]